MKNLLLFLLAATLFACTKDQDENKFSLDDFFAKHKPKEQVFSFFIDSAYRRTLTTEKGATVSFNNPFYDDNNNNVSGAEVNMKVIEVYNKSDMILSGLNTEEYYGRTLKSTGMMYLKFESNGNAVRPGSVMNVVMPANPDYFYQGADLYYLDNSPQVNSWVDINLGVFAHMGSVIDSCGLSNCFNRINFQGTHILIDYNWLNCDDIIDTPYTSVAVNPTASDTITVYKSFVVLKNYMAAVNMNYSFSDSALVAPNIPVAEPVTVIIIGTNAEGVVYSGIKEFIVSENIEVDVSLNPTTEEELLAAIRALD